MSAHESRAKYASDVDAEELVKRAESLAVDHSDGLEERKTGVLLFSLGSEWYGVHIEAVREIYKEYTITPIPCVPDHVAGVINIRGEIVSVLDLGIMLGLGPTARKGPDEESTPVIVVSDESVSAALLVDSIGDIADIGTDTIEAPLTSGDRKHVDFVSGTFFVAGRLVALVNLARVLIPVITG